MTLVVLILDKSVLGGEFGGVILTLIIGVFFLGEAGAAFGVALGVAFLGEALGVA